MSTTLRSTFAALLFSATAAYAQDSLGLVRDLYASASYEEALSALGRREDHFQGGNGTSTPWPAILPMWFTYTNPVSGRVPPNHQPDCVLCALRPDLKLSANGYQEAPDAPVANRSPP